MKALLFKSKAALEVDAGLGECSFCMHKEVKPEENECEKNIHLPLPSATQGGTQTDS